LPNNNDIKGRPSLLNAEQQEALEKKNVAAPPSPAASAGMGKWQISAALLLALGAVGAAIWMNRPMPDAGPAPLAAAPSPPIATAAAALPVPPAATAPEAPAAAAPAAEPPQVASIIDDAPPARPAESLKQMLEGGKAEASAPARPKARTVAAHDKPAAKATPAPQPDSDVELLAALVAHAKAATSADARMPLVKELEQCKRQDKRDAARCRLRVCDARWKTEECRVYNRSKLERSAGAA